MLSFNLKKKLLEIIPHFSINGLAFYSLKGIQKTETTDNI